MKRTPMNNPINPFGGSQGDSADDGMIQTPVDRMMHEVLDAEARGDQAAARAWYRAAVAADPTVAQRLREHRRVLTQLRRAPAAPDLTSRVLAGVAAERPFVRSRPRRRTALRVSATHVAVAASIVITASLVWFVNSTDRVSEAPALASAGASVERSGSAPRAAAEERIVLHAEVDRIAAEPAQTSLPREPLALGDISRYDIDPGRAWSDSTAESLFGVGDLLGPAEWSFEARIASGPAVVREGQGGRLLLSPEPAGLWLNPLSQPPSATVIRSRPLSPLEAELPALGQPIWPPRK